LSGPAVDERGERLLRRVLAGTPAEESPLTHSEVLPARTARTAEWPSWAPPTVVDALRASGIKEPWSHQVEAAEATWRGEHVVLATGTASGKSLAYQLPVLSALTLDQRATALYLSPTKALAADQLRSLSALGVPGLRAASFDGDTPLAERDWVRAHARWVFTNPDMLHRSILPSHGRWASWLRRLRYVVIDECHTYRGVFGSHVALLLRRLRRIAVRCGAQPVFVLASATAAAPAESAAVLIGLPVTAVTDDGSPSGTRTVALWEPPLLRSADGLGGLAGENGAPVRRSAGAETSRILADLVVEGARTIAFVRSRRGAELTALGTRRALAEVSPELPPRVAAYRGGYLPEERRELERSLADGSLLGVASTNALELGMDIAGLDAVVVAGYPGTVASFWQQAGRAGRSGEGALVVFVARDDPLDTYLAHHPAALLGRPIEACVLDPANPYVLEPQLACAAAELPVTEADVATLFGPAARAALDSLVAQGFLRRRPSGWFWSVAGERPHGTVDIRGSGGEQIVVVENDTGRMLGTVDPASAHTQVHPGAVYLHQGRSYVVDALELDESLALVHAEEPSWSTSARQLVDITVLATQVSAVYRDDAMPPAADGALSGGGDATSGSGDATDGRTGGGSSATSGATPSKGGLRDGITASRAELENSATPSKGGLRVGATASRAELENSVTTGGAKFVNDATTGEVGLGIGGAADEAELRIGGAVGGAGLGDGVAVGVALGEVEVTSQVVGYLRRPPSGAVLDQIPLDLPARRLRTKAVWYTVSAALLSTAGLDAGRVPGALHAAEHAAIGLLPLFAVCDRWDIGGVSTALHPDTGEATVFVHDGHAGGAGFADRGFAALRPWLAATRGAIASCECPAGCPSCVQSPKCGNGNEPLDKAGAGLLLDAVLARLP